MCWIRPTGQVDATLRAVTGVIDANARTMTTVFDIRGEAVPAGSIVRLALDNTVEERGVWVPVGALTEGNRGLWVCLCRRRIQW